MATATDPFTDWLAEAHIRADRLTPEQGAVLRAALRFRQRCGTDYYSSRLLSHFLLHCDTGLPVAQIARLVRISRPTASRQQGLSSKEAIQQAHHRMDGRPYGKLLPRYAGPVAEFLFTRPQASRADLIDFIDRTFGVRVSRVALHHFLKKFGLDAASRQATAAPPSRAADVPPPVAAPVGPATPAADPVIALPPPTPFVPPGQPVPTPAPPFSPRARSSRVPSCCCRRRWTGWPRPATASATTTARCSAAC